MVQIWHDIFKAMPKKFQRFGGKTFPFKNYLILSKIFGFELMLITFRGFSLNCVS